MKKSKNSQEGQLSVNLQSHSKMSSAQEHFSMFSAMDNPYVGIVAEVECTKAFHFSKERKQSFFATYLHCSMLAENSVEEFKYRIEDDEIYIYVKNRNMLADPLRSLAHEIRHFKQKLDNVLVPTSGDDGSPHEDEAHCFSGLMIRLFGKSHPEIFN